MPLLQKRKHGLNLLRNAKEANMKFLILLLLPLTIFAYDSNEEIDNLDQKDFLQQILPKVCRASFKDGFPRTFENLEMLSYKRKNCDGKGIIDSLQECDDVDFTCTKPSQEDMDGFFADFKAEEKVKLGKRQAQAAKAAEKKALKEDQKSRDLNLVELNKILRD